MEQRSFSHIPTYVFKAESALDSIGTPGHSSSGLGYGSSAVGAGGSGPKKIDLHQAVEAKLGLCNALSHLANGNYAKATQEFLQPMSAAALAPWNGTIISMGDIAVYATLCALATLGRSELKARVIESEGLAGEGDGMKELLDAWMASNFRLVLGLLEKYTVSALITGTLCTVIGFFCFVLSFPPDHNASLAFCVQARYLLDPLLGPHVGNLTVFIRSRAVVLYFQPFATIRLERMSAAFGWRVEDTEREVVTLIQRGEILGRVDSQNKILRARSTNHRALLYAHALKAGTNMQSATKKLLLRLQLCARLLALIITPLLTPASNIFFFCSQQANLFVRKARPPPAPTSGALESSEQ